MVKEIGSDFKLNPGIIFRKNKNNIPNTILLSTGRDCISHISNSFQNKTLLLPSYLCDTILLPIKENNIKYFFYKIDKDLEVDLKDLNKKVEKLNPDLIFVINYFGFIQPKLSEIKKICQSKNIKLIEDNVQSFLTTHEIQGDYSFNSYRKFLPAPDGAFLYSINEDLQLNSPYKKFYLTRFYASLIKNIKILKKIYRNWFVKTEDTYINNYKKPARMSNLSKYILNKFDFEDIKHKRAENFMYLLKNLTNKKIKSLFIQLESNVCPLGFPIIMESENDRNRLKEILIKNKIYPPIHWTLPDELNKTEFKDSIDISKRILTIPIDQRYNIKDMKRILNILNIF